MPRIEPEPQPNLQNPPTNTNCRPLPPWIRVMSAEQRRNFSNLMHADRQQPEPLNKQRADARRKMIKSLVTENLGKKPCARLQLRWPELKRIWDN